MRRVLSAALLALLTSCAVWSAPLSLGVRGYDIKHDLFSLFAAPGENLHLELQQYDTSRMQLYLDGVAYGEPGRGVWSFTAPGDPGLYKLQLAHLDTHDRTALNLFVGIPATEQVGDYLGDYRIGPPPPGNSKYPGRYRAPHVFFEVTADNQHTRLSPHFTLGQFLCKQESDFPKYVVIQESLLVLLEELIDEVQSAGYPVETFGVISGYRTPYYNKRIGNVANSRHVYGDAFDFFVDVDNDGRMDDLNRDGFRDAKDVDFFYELVTTFKARTENAVLVGGVGRYYPRPHHGGFVHVDTRGYRARW